MKANTKTRTISTQKNLLHLPLYIQQHTSIRLFHCYTSSYIIKDIISLKSRRKILPIRPKTTSRKIMISRTFNFSDSVPDLHNNHVKRNNRFVANHNNHKHITIIKTIRININQQFTMAKWNKKKHSVGSKEGAGGGNAKGKGTMHKGGKNNLDLQEEDLVNDNRGAGGAKNDHDNPINVDGKRTTNDVGFGITSLNNSPASKEDSHDLLGDDDTKDSSETGTEDNQGKVNKTV